jgi:hypothetical protein
VATKMQWATVSLVQSSLKKTSNVKQINEEHESLKQKWNSISNMMK